MVRPSNVERSLTSQSSGGWSVRLPRSYFAWAMESPVSGNHLAMTRLRLACCVESKVPTHDRTAAYSSAEG